MGLRIFCLVFLVLPGISTAATSYWKNANGGLYYSNPNWVNGIPATNDAAVFTNETSFGVQWSIATAVTDASFRGTGVVTQNIQTFSWTVKTNYIVGDALDADATIVHRSGTLNVTNSSKSAQLKIGASAPGKYILQGGTLNVDSLVSTNDDNSLFRFDYGTLRTRNMNLMDPNGQFPVGTVSNQIATWFIDGTNILKATDNFDRVYLQFGPTPGAQVTVILNGTNAHLEVKGSVHYFQEAEFIKPTIFIVTNGASASMDGFHTGGGIITNTVGHQIIVTGSSSHLNAGGLDLVADKNSLLVSNGAAVHTVGFQTGDNCKILITGTNSTLNLEGVGLIGGFNTQLIISNGASLNGLEGAEIQTLGPNTQLRVNGADFALAALHLEDGSLVIDKGNVSIGYGAVESSASIELHSGVLSIPEGGIQVSESENSWRVGGYPNHATLNLPVGFDCSRPLVLGTNTTMNMSGNIFTTQFSATNGPSTIVNFNRGIWTTMGTEIQIGRELEIGDETNAAVIQFYGGQHAFAHGLRILAGSTFTEAYDWSVVTPTTTISGDITLDDQSTWVCDLRKRLTRPNQPNFVITGNLNIHGMMVLTNVHPFVPVRYVLATYTGTLNTNGATVSGLPPSYAGFLDTSVPGELAINVKFIGPLPPNSLGNVVVISNATSLSFGTTNFATYLVEYSDSLLPTTWIPLVTVPGTSAIISVVDTNAATRQRFYRLKTMPSP